MKKSKHEYLCDQFNRDQLKSDECKCNDMGMVKGMMIIKQSDVKIVDGKFKLKRKYGKFKRKITILDLRKNK